jgi:hypothetical protein
MARLRDPRTGANVVPVGIVGGQLLEGGGLDVALVRRRLNLRRLLEVGGQRLDEGLSHAGISKLRGGNESSAPT